MFSYNTIFFRRANKVVAPAAAFSTPLGDNFALVASLDANLRKLGYALSGDLALALLHARPESITSFHDSLVSTAKEVKGVRRYSPMYPNFPHQVMEASDAELYLNAVMHYFGTAAGLRILPVYDEKKRPELEYDESKVTVITGADESEFIALMVKVFQSKSAWSEADRADVEALRPVMFATVYNYSSNALTNRENKATIGALALGHEFNIIHKMDTATDVLRLAVALSGGDVSLAEKTKFRNFKRSERRNLLAILNNVDNAAEDMLRHQSAWKRLGEKLHPGEFTQFPNAVKAFEAVRANGAVTVFNARVEKSLAIGDTLAVAALLSTRPGEFARRLDHVLRTAKDTKTQMVVLDAFAAVAHKAAPTVLIQARNAFSNREKDARVFFPKGNVAKLQTIGDTRKEIPGFVLGQAVSVLDRALVKAFADRDDLGGSWVDPALKKVAVPFALRNSSKAIKTLGRGSRLALDAETGVIRFFIWWKDSKGTGGWGYRSHTDIDLSAIVLDENFNNVFDITYYNLREQGAVHSGDITSAPNGASEFIDIDIERIKEQGGRYVAMTLYSYSGQDFVELPECFAGFMERADLGSGEIYDPRTVTNKVDLTAASKSATPFIFDLETGEAIWVDLTQRVNGMYANAYNARSVTKTVAQAMVELTPPNLYDLFVAHAEARGGLVAKDKAKTIFAFDGDVSPFDTEEILAKFL